MVIVSQIFLLISPLISVSHLQFSEISTKHPPQKPHPKTPRIEPDQSIANEHVAAKPKPNDMGMNLSSFHGGHGLGKGLQEEREGMVVWLLRYAQSWRVESDGVVRTVAPSEAANEVVGGEDGGVSEGSIDGEGVRILP